MPNASPRFTTCIRDMLLAVELHPHPPKLSTGNNILNSRDTQGGNVIVNPGPTCPTSLFAVAVVFACIPLRVVP